MPLKFSSLDDKTYLLKVFYYIVSKQIKISMFYK